MTFAKGSKISSFTMELCQIRQEIYSLTDKETIKSIAASHILSTIDRFMGEDVRILLISGNMRLETLLGFVDSKYNNALQSFLHYVSDNNFYQNSTNQNTPKSGENKDMKEMKEMIKQLLKLQLDQSVNPVQQNCQRVCSN